MKQSLNKHTTTIYKKKKKEGEILLELEISRKEMKEIKRQKCFHHNQIVMCLVKRISLNNSLNKCIVKDTCILRAPIVLAKCKKKVIKFKEK